MFQTFLQIALKCDTSCKIYILGVANIFQTFLGIALKCDTI